MDEVPRGEVYAIGRADNVLRQAAKQRRPDSDLGNCGRRFKMRSRRLDPPRSQAGSAPVGDGEASHAVGVPRDYPGRGGAPHDQPGRKQRGCEVKRLQDKNSNIFKKYYLHLFASNLNASVFFPTGYPGSSKEE